MKHFRWWLNKTKRRLWSTYCVVVLSGQKTIVFSELLGNAALTKSTNLLLRRLKFYWKCRALETIAWEKTCQLLSETAPVAIHYRRVQSVPPRRLRDQHGGLVSVAKVDRRSSLGEQLLMEKRGKTSVQLRWTARRTMTFSSVPDDDASSPKRQCFRDYYCQPGVCFTLSNIGEMVVENPSSDKMAPLVSAPHPRYVLSDWCHNDSVCIW